MPGGRKIVDRASGVDTGSTWGRPGVDPESTWSTWDLLRVDLGTQDRPRVDGYFQGSFFFPSINYLILLINLIPLLKFVLGILMSVECQEINLK